MAIGNLLYKSVYWKTAQLISSFIVTVIYARILRSAVTGEFYSLVYLLSLCTSLFTFGLDIGLNYYLSRREITTAFAVRIIGILVLLALPAGLSFLWWYDQPARFPGIGLHQLLLFSACQIAGVLMTVLAGTIFTAYGQNYRPAQWGVFINGATAVLSVVSAALLPGHRAVVALFFIYFGFSLIQGLVLLIAAIRLNAKAPVADDGVVDLANTVRQGAPVGIRDILRFSSGAFVTNFIFFVGARMGLYLLPYYATSANQGNYIQAYKLVEYAGLIAGFIYYPFITLVARDQAGQITEKVLLLVRLSNTAVLLFSLGVLATGWYLFPVIFGPSFNSMYNIFIGFIPGLFAACSSTFFTAYYFGIGHFRINLISASIQLISAVALFFLFTRAWGIHGTALAFSMAALLSMVYDCWMFRRYAGYTLKDLLLAGRSDWTRLERAIRSGLTPIVQRRTRRQKNN
jgi:O-antigen/teichoic acid export membrane protein